MNIFDNIVYNSLFESVVHISKDALDPTVFTITPGGEPILQESVRIQILKDVDDIRMAIPVVNFFMIGSILTKNYSEDSDIDVTVEVDAQLIDSIATSELMHKLTLLNGKLASGTTHPINYYLITSEFDVDKAEAVYDVVNNKWIKQPKEYDVDVDKWYNKFQDTLKSIDIATGEIRRDLIDLDEIKALNSKSKKSLRFVIKQKLSQIEELLKHLVSTYKDIKLLRKMAFDRFKTPQEIHLYGTANHLPENILYKLLEKYYYIKFIKKIESILDDDDELDLTDVPRVNKVMSDLWNRS